MRFDRSAAEAIANEALQLVSKALQDIIEAAAAEVDHVNELAGQLANSERGAEKERREWLLQERERDLNAERLRQQLASSWQENKELKEQIIGLKGQLKEVRSTPKNTTPGLLSAADMNPALSQANDFIKQAYAIVEQVGRLAAEIHDNPSEQHCQREPGLFREHARAVLHGHLRNLVIALQQLSPKDKSRANEDDEYNSVPEHERGGFPDTLPETKCLTPSTVASFTPPCAQLQLVAPDPAQQQRACLRPAPTPLTIDTGDDGDGNVWRFRIMRFFRKYMPDQLNEAEMLLKKYSKKEDQLMVMLVKRHGPEPNEKEELAGLVQFLVQTHGGPTDKTFAQLNNELCSLLGFDGALKRDGRAGTLKEKFSLFWAEEILSKARSRGHDQQVLGVLRRYAQEREKDRHLDLGSGVPYQCDQ